MAALAFDSPQLLELYRQNAVSRLSLFGSFARGEAREDSDIDLLVEFSQRKSLLALVSLQRQLSAAIGRKVDLLTEAAISPYIRENVRRDLRTVYEAG
jgi:predicted nucleotidyltransferase